jgi:hypothetical protein
MVVLSYQHRKMGPIVLHAFPKQELDDQLSGRVANILNQTVSEGFFTFSSEDKLFMNFYFEIPSAWAKGNNEKVMVSLILDHQISAEMEHNLMNLCAEFCSKLQLNGEISTAFYISDINNMQRDNKKLILKNDEILAELVKELYWATIEETREKSEEEEIATLLTKRHVYLTLSKVSKGPISLEKLNEWFNESFPLLNFKELMDKLVEKQLIFITQVGFIEKYVFLSKEVRVKRIPPECLIKDEDVESGFPNQNLIVDWVFRKAIPNINPHQIMKKTQDLVKQAIEQKEQKKVKAPLSETQKVELERVLESELKRPKPTGWVKEEGMKSVQEMKEEKREAIQERLADKLKEQKEFEESFKVKVESGSDVTKIKEKEKKRENQIRDLETKKREAPVNLKNDIMNDLFPKVHEYFNLYYNKSIKELQDDSHVLLQIVSDSKKYNILLQLRKGFFSKDELSHMLSERSLKYLDESLEFLKLHDIIEVIKYDNESYMALKTDIQITTEFPRYLSNLRSGGDRGGDYPYPYIFYPPTFPEDLAGALKEIPRFVSRSLIKESPHCKHCGGLLPEGASICPNCGNKVIF